MMKDRPGCRRQGIRMTGISTGRGIVVGYRMRRMAVILSVLVLAACQSVSLSGPAAGSAGASVSRPAGPQSPAAAQAVAIPVPGPGPVPDHAPPPADRMADTPVRSDPVQPLANDRQATDLRVFLADVHDHPGWTPVPLKPSGILYVRTDAIINRSDLMGIQSATDQAGGGLLVLILKDEGLAKLRAATSAHPGLRLALVVGQIMLAAPAYATPISEQKLAFAVGSLRNAEIAARSVAGVP